MVTLTPFNVDWVRKAQSALAIDIHQCPAIVGNMSSSAKMEFTAIGDSVKTSSRLESATKQYGVNILVSQPVWEKTVAHFIFRSADLVVVKGKKVPVQIHAILSGCHLPPLYVPDDDLTHPRCSTIMASGECSVRGPFWGGLAAALSFQHFGSLNRE